MSPHTAAWAPAQEKTLTIWPHFLVPAHTEGEARRREG